MRYLILGGGPAGIAAAKALRKAKSDAEIVIATEETETPYLRPLLPDLILGTARDEMILDPQGRDLGEKGVRRLTGRRAVRLDIGNRIVGPLFIGQQGKHISSRAIQHIFKHYAPQGITPHKIRHSYASELYKRSKNLRVVQENLGHTSIKTTEIYLHTDIDERRQVYQQYFPLSGTDGKA